MRVLVCPDKFAGTLSAGAAARALADGWRSVAPADEVTLIPLADGGPGFLDALHTALGGELVEVATTDPLGRPVRAHTLRLGATGYVESAQACGLHLLASGERDARIASSAGVGGLIPPDASEVVIGLGGSASNDGGAGLLGALGVVPVDADGAPLPPGGLALARCTGLRIDPARRRPQLVAASDVDSPLTGPNGATYVYGPQKGARAEDLAALDAALAHFATVLERDLPGCPSGLATRPGAGAAGGLGAAILALGGRRVSGLALVRQVTGLDAALAACDLVITGEGSFDGQSLRGKVVGGVAAAAAERGVPCVVVAGRVQISAEEAGVTGAYSLVDAMGGVDAAMADPARGLRLVAARLARGPGAP